MSRASKERERLQRRVVHQSRQAARSKSTNVHDEFLSATPEERRQEAEYRAHHNGKDTAVHEAGHAVAAWLQGVKIVRMMFNDRGSVYYDAAADHLEAMTETGAALTADEIKDNRSALQGTAEGFIRGCQSAFITLAGAVAQALYLNKGDSPITMREHGGQAAKVLRFYSGLSEDAVITERNRLIPVVSNALQDERIKYVTLVLARAFYEKRYLSGESVTNIIEAAWSQAERRNDHQENISTKVSRDGN